MKYLLEIKCSAFKNDIHPHDTSKCIFTENYFWSDHNFPFFTLTFQSQSWATAKIPHCPVRFQRASNSCAFPNEKSRVKNESGNLNPCLFLELTTHLSSRTIKEITKVLHVSARRAKATDFIFYSNWRHFLHPCLGFGQYRVNFPPCIWYSAVF